MVRLLAFALNASERLEPTRGLCVDDEPDLLELVRVNLDQAGFEVETAASGQEALSALRKERPGLERASCSGRSPGAVQRRAGRSPRARPGSSVNTSP